MLLIDQTHAICDLLINLLYRKLQNASLIHAFVNARRIEKKDLNELNQVPFGTLCVARVRFAA